VKARPATPVKCCPINANLHVIGKAVNGERAIQQMTILKPDVALLDIRRPDKTGMKSPEERIE
jgi:YesN/AraC family two-component response regulator